MSFTTDIKQEIANNELKDHCKKAELSALIQLTSSLSFTSNGLGLIIRSESATVGKRIVFLLKDLYNVNTEIEYYKKTNLKKNRVYTITIDQTCRDIIEDLGIYTSKGLQSHPSYQIVSRDCCAKAYLAGCFLAYGSCNAPNKTNYHLELSLSDLAHANFVVKLISKYQINAKITKRRNKYVVYIKKADYISDFLAILGANNARLLFEDERISRDMRNSFSRIDNCDIANEVKTIRAASRQIESIQKLIDSKEYDKLDEKIKNVIDLRLKYQDYSLLELCDAYQKIYGDVISKSGMKHRLNKIEALSKGLED